MVTSNIAVCEFVLLEGLEPPVPRRRRLQLLGFCAQAEGPGLLGCSACASRPTLSRTTHSRRRIFCVGGLSCEFHPRLDRAISTHSRPSTYDPSRSFRQLLVMADFGPSGFERVCLRKRTSSRGRYALCSRVEWLPHHARRIWAPSSWGYRVSNELTSLTT